MNILFLIFYSHSNHTFNDMPVDKKVCYVGYMLDLNSKSVGA